jgi:hypothetical protein
MLDCKVRDIKALKLYPVSDSNPYKPQGSGLYEVINLGEIQHYSASPANI